MASMTNEETRGANRWRIMAWGGAAMLLALPAVAMQFTPDVTWTATDFVTMGVILGSLALAFEFLLRRGGFAYRTGSAVALGAVFLLTWINLAVGIIGDEGDPANLMFAGVIAIATGGAIVARFRAAGMALAMIAAASAQLLAGAIALAGGMGTAGPIWPREIIVLSIFFVGLWLSAAWLFRQAART